MRNKRLRWTFIAVSIALALVIARLGWPYAGWLMFGVKTEVMNYQDFVVSGIVVDASGAPLDVRVEIQKSWKRKMGFERDHESTYASVNGKFDFSVSNCDSVFLYFLKQGYQMEQLNFTRNGKYQNLRVVMKPKSSKVP